MSSTFANSIDPTSPHMNSAEIHAAARHKNFPIWLKQANSGALANLDLAHLPTGYLQDLYPNIWQYGPAGETYLSQLKRLHACLYTRTFVHQALKHTPALNSVERLFGGTPLIENLFAHATRAGIPKPGNHILYGMDGLDIPQHPVNLLLNHITWEKQPGEVYEAFDTFLYRFSLTTIHHAYLTDLNQDSVNVALQEYATFCDRWDITR